MDVCRQLCDVCVNVCRKPDGPHDVKFLIYEHTPAYYAQQSPIAISRLTGKLRVSITCCSTRRNSKVVSPFFFYLLLFSFFLQVVSLFQAFISCFFLFLLWFRIPRSIAVVLLSHTTQLVPFCFFSTPYSAITPTTAAVTCSNSNKYLETIESVYGRQSFRCGA